MIATSSKLVTKLDLEGQNAAEFDLHTEFPSNPEFDEALKAYLPVPSHGKPEDSREPGFLVFHDLYTRKHVKIERVILLHQAEGGQQYHLAISYEANPDSPLPPNSLVTPAKAFELLKPITDPLNFSVFARFAYPVQRFQSVFGLPIAFAGGIGSPFDEIRGFRVNKYTPEKKVKYTIVIDYPIGETIHQSITYSYLGKLTPGLAGDAFRYGLDVSTKFVRSIASQQ